MISPNGNDLHSHWISQHHQHILRRKKLYYLPKNHQSAPSKVSLDQASRAGLRFLGVASRKEVHICPSLVIGYILQVVGVCISKFERKLHLVSNCKCANLRRTQSLLLMIREDETHAWWVVGCMAARVRHYRACLGYCSYCSMGN